MWNTFVEWLNSLDWEGLVQILVAVVLGGLIGLEREFTGRAAGLRTHILVCVGATIIVLASGSIPRIFGDNFQETLRIDPGRIAAGIVTGIGFLGAGAILRKGSYVRGLTTAACIWFAASLGIVIGLRFYFLAASSTAVVLLVLRIDDLFESRIAAPVYRKVRIEADTREVDALARRVESLLKRFRVRIQDLDYGFHREGNRSVLTYYVRTRSTFRSLEVVDAIREEPELISVTWEN